MYPSAKAVIDVAISLLPKHIPYVMGGESLSKMDCQGFVEYCVREAGGESDFAGSNDMWRNDVVWTGTIAAAKAQGRLISGAAVFVVKHDNGEPEQYRGDGIGNANHVGLYCARPEAECMSASAVTGFLGATTLSQGWTHVAWLKSINYASRRATEQPNDTAAAADLPDIDYPKAIAAARAFIEAVGAVGKGVSQNG